MYKHGIEIAMTYRSKRRSVYGFTEKERDSACAYSGGAYFGFDLQGERVGWDLLLRATHRGPVMARHCLGIHIFDVITDTSLALDINIYRPL